MAPRRTKSAPGQLTLGVTPTSLVRLVLAGCTSGNTRASYRKSLSELSDFAEGRPLTKMILLEWRGLLAERLAVASVNLRLTAARRLVREAQRTGAIAPEVAAELLDVRGLPQRGSRSGNWLSVAQLRRLLAVPDRKTLRGKRNYCILAILSGCALRRQELASLEFETVQLRDGRWIFADLPGKGGRVRSVAVPVWVKAAIDDWVAAAEIGEGRLIRQLTGSPAGLSSYAIWEIVSAAAAKIGVERFGPHDLRRTCARLCRQTGGEIEQIKFMLGHASIQTTERYLGATQNLSKAVNDNLGL